MKDSGKKPFILFITGTSASGKTTLYESLQKDDSLSGIHFHDMDENGVPPVGRTPWSPWRSYRVEELLYQAVLDLQQGNSTIICGMSKPFEVINSVYFKRSYNIHFLLVKVPYEVFEKRIVDRVAGQAKTGPFDAEFDNGTLQRILIANDDLLHELDSTISQLKNGYSIETTKLTKQQMHDKAAGIIKQIQVARTASGFAGNQ